MLFTIGHSNRPWERFLTLLKGNSITILVDVRLFPSSKTWPQYNREAMHEALKKEGIAYVHMPELGGRRKPDGSPTNAGWEVEAFRGYADYMQSNEFRDAAKELLKLKGNVCLMCAEAVPWRCHRRLISDYLTAQGVEVYEIISEAPPKVHPLTPFAKIVQGIPTYPSVQRTL